MTIDISLRPITELDVDEFFAHRQARGEAEPSGYPTFITRWRKILDDPNVKVRTIAVADQVVGYISHFTREGLPEVSYELGPQYWGKGFATAALRQFVGEIGVRPLYARAAKENSRSIRVLQKCGFSPVGEDRFVSAGGNRVEEFIFALDDMAGSLVVLTGASGAGKTTIALAIGTMHPEFPVFRFDTIGIPSAEVMATFGAGHQPGGAWQRAMTLQWFERIAPILKAGDSVLFEGQMRIAFIQEGLATYDILHAHVILVECGDETRSARLTKDRQQPELANDSMMRWSRYLHQEALEVGCEILDTGAVPLGECVRRIVTYLGKTSTSLRSIPRF